MTLLEMLQFLVLLIIHYLINTTKKNFLVLCEGPTDDINNSIATAKKKFSINFSKAKRKFCLSLHYNGDNSYLHVYKSEICKFKTHDNICWCEFYLGSVSKYFPKDEQSEMSLDATTVYNFSVHHSSNEKEEIQSIFANLYKK